MNPLIAKLERLDALSRRERETLEAVLSPVRAVGPDEEIIREGDRPTESTLLLSGYAGRYNLLPDGRRQITAIHVAGDFVDLHSFLLHTMDHGVVTMSSCTLATAPHDLLRRVTEEHPHLARVLWLSTLIDASIHRRWLVGMGRQSAEAQLAHLLCELWTRLEVVGLTRGLEFNLPLTQTELADALGLSPVHVNRVLQELRRRKLISWAAGRLEIQDMEGLKDLAEFDPGFLHLVFEPR